MIIVDLLDTYVCVENLTNKNGQDGQGGVMYLDSGSDCVEVEPLSSRDDEGDESSNKDEVSSDKDK